MESQKMKNEMEMEINKNKADEMKAKAEKKIEKQEEEKAKLTETISAKEAEKSDLKTKNKEEKDKKQLQLTDADEADDAAGCLDGASAAHRRAEVATKVSFLAARPDEQRLRAGNCHIEPLRVDQESKVVLGVEIDKIFIRPDR